MSGVQQVMAGARNAAASMQQLAASSSGMQRFKDAFSFAAPSVSAMHQHISDVHDIWQKFTSILPNGIEKIQSMGTHMVENGLIMAGFASNAFQATSYLGQYIGMVGQGISAMFAQNATMEQTRVAYIGLMGGAKQADDMLAKLWHFAAVTPFEFTELTKDTQMLMGMGVAANDVIPYLTAIGDAAAGVGAGADGISRATLAIGQMTAAGKIGGQDMMQLVQVGIPGYQILAKAMGLSVAEVKKLGDQGKLGANEIRLLVGGMEKMYGGQMANQAVTFNGLLSTLHDNLTMALMTFMSPIFTEAKQGLITLGNLMGDPRVQAFTKELGVDAAQAIHRFSSFVMTEIVPALEHAQSLWERFDAILHGSGFKAASDALGSLATMLETHLGPTIQKVVTWFKSLFTDAAILGYARDLQVAFYALADAIGAISIILQPLVDLFVLLVNQFTDTGIKGELLRDALVGVAAAIAAFRIGTIVMALPGLIIGLYGTATAAWVAAGAFLALNWPLLLIAAAIGLAVVGIILAIQHWGQIVAWLKMVWGDIASFFVNLWARIKSQFFGDISEISREWVDLWTHVRDFFVMIWSAVVSYVTDRTHEFVNTVTGAWTNITTSTTNAWNGIITTIKNVLGTIGNYFHDRWTELSNTTKAIWDSQIVGYIRGVLETLYNIAVKLLGDVIGVLVSSWTTMVSDVRVAWNFVKTIVTDVFGAVYTYVSGVASQLSKYLSGRWNELKNTTHDAWLVIKASIIDPLVETYNKVSAVVNTIKNWIADRWHDIATNTSSTFNSIKDTVSTDFDKANTNLTNATNSMNNNIKNAWNWIKDNTVRIWGDITSFIGTQVNNVLNMINTNAPKIRDGLLGGFKWARDGIGGIVKGLGNLAIDQFNNFLSGLQNFLNDFGDALNNVAKAVGAAGVVPHVTIGRVAHFATGVHNFAGGPAIVGEEGPELMMVPRGASILPHKPTMNLLHGGKLGGLFPGFADGTGNPLSDLLAWMGKGASTVLSNVFHGTLSGVGMMGNIASGITSMATKWGTDMVSKLLSTVTQAVTGGTGGGSGGGSFSAQGSFPGNVASWILQAIGLTGVPGSWAGALETIAMKESGGNPGAANGWDINAINGTPSIGLMQTIMPTFLANMVAGHGNIYNPVDNAAAAIQYIERRYGSVFNVPGIISMAHGGAYVGYANGGVISEPIMGHGLNTGKSYMFGENGSEYVSPHGASSGNVTIVLQVDGRTLASALAPHVAQEIRVKTAVRR